MKQPIILHKDSNITVTMYPMMLFVIPNHFRDIRNDLALKSHKNQFTTEQMNQLALCC